MEGDSENEVYLASALGFPRVPLDPEDPLVRHGLVNDELTPEEREVWDDARTSLGIPDRRWLSQLDLLSSSLDDSDDVETRPVSRFGTELARSSGFLGQSGLRTVFDLPELGGAHDDEEGEGEDWPEPLRGENVGDLYLHPWNSFDITVGMPEPDDDGPDDEEDEDEGEDKEEDDDDSGDDDGPDNSSGAGALMVVNSNADQDDSSFDGELGLDSCFERGATHDGGRRFRIPSISQIFAAVEARGDGEMMRGWQSM